MWPPNVPSPWALLSLLLGLLLSTGTAEDPDGVGKTHVRVTTILVEPYAMIRWGTTRNITRHTRYEGYIVDLMDKVSEILGFRYQISPVKDERYGYQLSDGTWDGMVGELIRKEADIAAAPLYITEHRSEVVDFSRPFLTVKATVLLRRPPTGQKYTIESAEDLLDQSEIAYGTLNTGVIIRKFRRANDSIISSMWRNMKKFHPPVFTRTNEEGINRVRTNKYAFILPSTIGEYISKRRPCDLITVDRFLMEQGYGIALPKGSALVSKLNKVLNLLETNGFLHHLYHKWWNEKSECNGIKTSKHTFSPNTAVVFQSSHNLILTVSIGFMYSYSCLS